MQEMSIIGLTVLLGRGTDIPVCAGRSGLGDDKSAIFQAEIGPSQGARGVILLPFAIAVGYASVMFAMGLDCHGRGTHGCSD